LNLFNFFGPWQSYQIIGAIGCHWGDGVMRFLHLNQVGKLHAALSYLRKALKIEADAGTSAGDMIHEFIGQFRFIIQTYSNH